VIYVDRSKVRKPKTLASSAVKKDLDNARAFFGTPERDRRQHRHEFRLQLYKADDVMKALIELFHGKCAYCETKIDNPVDLDHFRPKSRAMNHDGKVSADHYWWLAYEWENLYLACAYCNRSKATRFPVTGSRLVPFQSVLEEQALLVDPCRDKPELHLVFTEEGLVVGQSERGKATVDLLNLNRDALVGERRAAMVALHDFLRSTRARGGKLEPADLDDRFTGLDAPHTGACNYFLHRLLTNDPGLVQWESDKVGLAQVEDQTISKDFETQLVEDYRRERKQHASYSVEAAGNEEERTFYFSGAKRIEQVALHNFKGITHLELRFPPPGSEHESWVMLLGENGTGKSTVLQAVALALMGESHANALGLDASTFVKREGKEDVAWVEVRLSGLDQPIRMTMRRDTTRFAVEPKDPKVLLMGYGATRLLPHSSQVAPVRRYIRIQNLFDPTAPLSDAESWLADETQLDEEQFPFVARALKDLLLLRDDDSLHREGGIVYADVMGSRLTLRQLSDGLQSVLALATDIIIATHDHWPSMQDAEGIVLLDEIEAHLHPSWKLQIVQRLRRTFPRLNFLVTTHDPLCLRGLEDGEIALLRRDRGYQIEVVTDVPSVAHLRADQILTSFLFALPSTRGADSATMVSRYSTLLGKKDRSAQEQKELQDLEANLRDMLLTGETPLQREVEQAVKKAFVEMARDQKSKPMRKPQITPDVEFEIRRQLTELLGTRDAKP
jgi:uncharacterized protein (TIGR02646 family)